MRRILGGVAAAVLALSAVPALAADEPALLAPCDVPAADRLPLSGLQTSVATPLLPTDVTERTVVLDLAGQPVGTTAIIDATVSWTVPANDYDLETTGGGSSDKINVTETAPFEQAAVGGFGHCDSFTVSVVNFAAPVVADSIRAKLAVALEEPVE